LVKTVPQTVNFTVLSAFMPTMKIAQARHLPERIARKFDRRCTRIRLLISVHQRASAVELSCDLFRQVARRFYSKIGTKALRTVKFTVCGTHFCPNLRG
jgi:hypothetical protein